MPDNTNLIPAGTVVAYAGPVEGDAIDANPPLPVVAIEGWLLCNGAEVPNDAAHKALFAAIQYAHGRGQGNNFKVPDFRGLFLRGVDRGAGRDPQSTERTTPVVGSGNDGDRVGSRQDDSTKKPNSRFATDTHNGHAHGDPTWNGGPGPFELATQFRGPGGFDYGAQSAPTTTAGEHSHLITGGDLETRPKNAYVNWIIKL